MTQSGSTYVFREKSWEPVVETDGDTLIYHVPVASGHFDKSFDFKITPAEFRILKDDEERRYFLYAALHAKYQMHGMTNAPLSDPLITNILCAPAQTVETLLSAQDRDSNGAVSNLVRILMERDQSPMRNGIWFRTRPT